MIELSIPEWKLLEWLVYRYLAEQNAKRAAVKAREEARKTPANESEGQFALRISPVEELSRKISGHINGVAR